MKTPSFVTITAILSACISQTALAGGTFTYEDGARVDAIYGAKSVLTGAAIALPAKGLQKLSSAERTLLDQTIVLTGENPADVDAFAHVLDGHSGITATAKPIPGDGIILENEGGLAHLMVERKMPGAALRDYLQALRSEGSAVKAVELRIVKNPTTQGLRIFKVGEWTGAAIAASGVLELLHSGYLFYKSRTSESKIYDIEGGKIGGLQRAIEATYTDANPRARLLNSLGAQ